MYGFAGIVSVVSLHSASAAGAAAHRHIETGEDRGDLGQVFHPLGHRLDRHQFPITAMGAQVRQPDGNHPVGVALRDRTPRMGPVVLTGFAARFLRCRFRVAFGERCRLAFPAPADLFNQPLQLIDPLRLHIDNAPKLKILSYQVLDRGRPLKARRGVVSRNSPVYTIPVFRWWTPLNKYIEATSVHASSARSTGAMWPLAQVTPAEVVLAGPRFR